VDHPSDHINKDRLAVEEEELEDFRGDHQIVVIDEEDDQLVRKTGSHHARLLLFNVLVNCATVLAQIVLEVEEHLVDARRVVHEDCAPVTHEHDVDEAPECVLLVGYHLQKHAGYEIHSLAVPDFRVVRAVGFENVVEAIFASVCRIFELLDLWERPPQVFLYSVLSLVVFLVDKLLEDTALVLRLGLMHFADELPDFAAQTIAVDSFKTLVETLSDAHVAQMLKLQSEIGLDPIFGLNFLNRVHQDGHPFVLCVRLLQVELVNRLVLDLDFFDGPFALPKTPVPLPDHVLFPNLVAVG